MSRRSLKETLYWDARWLSCLSRPFLWAVGNIALACTVLYIAFVILPWIDRQQQFQVNREASRKQHDEDREETQKRQLTNEASLLSGQRQNLKLLAKMKELLEEETNEAQEW